MAERAKVHSIEALESFRASLIVYLEQAGVALDEIGDEVRRTKGWLVGDRRSHWQREVLRRAKLLEQRQQELFSARLSGLQEATQLQQMAVQKARRAVQEAEDRLGLVRRWTRQYDSRVEPLAREVEKLRHVLGQEMGKAVVGLTQTVRALAAYGEIAPRTSSSEPLPGATAENPAPESVPTGKETA